LTGRAMAERKQERIRESALVRIRRRFCCG
jgi:hypothetical protein